MYKQLQNAAYEPGELKDLSDIKAAAEGTGSTVVPMAVALAVVNKVGYEAYADYRLDFDDALNTFVRGPNSESPFEEFEFFTVAPLKSSVEGTSVTFVFSPAYYTTNTSEEPISYQVDFGDGQGFRQVGFNSSVSVSYASLGRKQIQVRANYSGQYREAKTEIAVTQSIPEVVPDPEITESSASADVEGEDVPYEYYGFFGEGNGNTLQKPIVILDGFDPADQVEIEGQRPRGLKAIYGLLDQPVEIGGVGFRMLSGLRNDGHDVFVLNYKDGADHIRRNAFTLVDLLSDVINQRTGGRKEIIVVGPSMGGLVARYALAYMEDEGIEHNVRLFISYDGPHQGANVPVGLQSFVDNFPLGKEDLKPRRKVFELPATRQLMAFNEYNGSEMSDPQRNALLNDLEALGSYPSHYRLRKVAVANGDGYGQPQVNDGGAPLESGNNIFNLEVGTETLGIGPGYEYRADAYAAPDAENGRIYRTRHYVTKRILFFKGRIKVPGAGIERHANALPYDSAPGGFRGFTGEAQGTTPAFDEWFEFLVFRIFAGAASDYPRQAFVPTVSALDYNTSFPQPYDASEQDLYYPVMEDVEQGADWQSRTPFDAILAQNGNKDHVDLTQRSYNFLLDEIYRVEQSLDLEGLTFSNPEPAFKAQQTITAGAAFTVESGGEVQLRAGGQVVLGPGFRVESGGKFAARYTLPSASDVTIEVFDMLGRRVATLANGPQKAGSHEVRWEARGVAGGASLCRMRAGAFAATNMMMLIR